ncbi:family 16 glycosylhydrolase [uncultured Sphingomonas sp.]|uniref:family 16 glycosylhydrolase n=1 Tax=uncultured Sphingomonas sp. TaxID=158754 RepID=UPI0035CA7483
MRAYTYIIPVSLLLAGGMAVVGLERQGGDGMTVASDQPPRNPILPTTPLPPLPPLDLSDMRLWNWAGKWHGSNWTNGMSPLPWMFDHIRKGKRGDVELFLDQAGAPELAAQNGTAAASRGLWEADVTLPQLRDGLVVAPLWLYDAASKDEVDFELAGRNGLDVTLHGARAGGMGQDQFRLFAGRDMSGERHRFGIKLDEATGYVEMYVDGVRVYRWDRGQAAVFPAKPLKPLIEMWAADPNNPGFVGWVGRWPGLASGERLTMTVHGYRYTPLP